MKHRIVNVLAALAIASLLLTLAAFAQNLDRLKADIPFDFIVSNKTLPAGTYQVHCAANGVVTLQGADQKAAAMVLTQGSYSRKPVTGKLIFSRYDNSYFLAQVWRPGIETGNLVRPSKLEREMANRAARAASTEVALNR